MRGHLEQRGKDVFRAKVYLGKDGNGKKRYLTKTIRAPKRKAEDELARMLVEAGVSSDVVTDGTLEDLALRWWAVAEPGLSPTTAREYRRLLFKVIIKRLGDRKVRTLRASDIDAMYGELAKTLSGQSVHHVHALLRRLLNQGVRWGWLSVSPIARTSPPAVKRKQIEPPSPAAVAQMMAKAEATNPDFACLLRLAAATGARRGELCALRWSDVDWKARSLTISRSVVGTNTAALQEKDTKTHGARRIALDAGTIEILKAQGDRCGERALLLGAPLAADGFIFSQDGIGDVPLRPDAVTTMFVTLRDEVGAKGVRLHDLRHFAATQLLAAGVPVRTVAGRLGHANPATTLNVYAAWLKESDQEAAATLGRVLGD